MTTRKYFYLLALMVAGCADPEAARRLEADIESINERISQAQEERKAYGKGSVVHDLISLRIAIHQQTLAMLEQRRAAGRWRTTLTYTVDGKSYTAPSDSVARVAGLQAGLKNAREGREADLQLVRGAAESGRPTSSKCLRAISFLSRRGKPGFTWSTARRTFSFSSFLSSTNALLQYFAIARDVSSISSPAL